LTKSIEQFAADADAAFVNVSRRVNGLVDKELKLMEIMAIRELTDAVHKLIEVIDHHGIGE
jgi:hypothetical protein